jgi:hypothetical protein
MRDSTTRRVTRRAVLAGGGVAATATLATAAPAFADDRGRDATADELALTKLAVYYGLGTDAIGRGDPATGLAYYRRIFTPDATISAGFDRSAPALTSTGPEEWAKTVETAFVPYQATQHLLATIDPEITGRNTGTIRSYLQATHVFKASLDLLIVLGYYDDEVVRTREGWRIATRFLQFVSFETRQRTLPPPVA